MANLEQKKALLVQARIIRDAVQAIMDMDDGNIVNDVAVDEYPFGASLDEVKIGSDLWFWAIEEEVAKAEKAEAKKA